jgi:germination protein M
MSALLRQLFGGEIQLLDWSHTGNTVHLLLSQKYDQLTGIDLTLAESSIVLTLCQLDSISRVQISLERSPGKIYSLRTAEDMLFTGAEEEPREVPVELYFPRSSGRGLGFESRVLILTEDDDLYSEVTRALLSGPESSGLQAPFPEDLEVLGSKLEGGVCHINFSSQLLDVEASAAAKDLLLYSIVDTLGNMDSVNSVQLMVEGEPLLHYGNTDTSMPLEPDFGLLAD